MYTNSLEDKVDVVERALAIGREAHKDITRKWGTKEPYYVHLERCVKKAKEYGLPEWVQCALAVHDLAEDVAIPTNAVPYWEGRIRKAIGDISDKVIDLMWELTNISDTKEWMERNPNPRRSEKWAVNLAHIRVISDIAKQCKMIDRIDNLCDMRNAPHRMKQKYIPESRDLLGACRYTNERLGKELEEAIDKIEMEL